MFLEEEGAGSPNLNVQKVLWLWCRGGSKIYFFRVLG